MSKIISFDIWDTILKRKCHPEEIKLHTANYIMLKYEDKLKEEYKDIYEILKRRDEIEEKICKENKEQGNDEECRILDVFSRLQKEIFKEEIKIEEELLQEEIAQEKRVIYINPEILPIFEKYKDLKMYAISDFYMSAEALKEILDSLDLPIHFEKIYSSADYLLNKRSGRLYQTAEQEIGIKPEEHIHIGDNPYSDIEMAKSLGIETIKMNKTNFDFAPKLGRELLADLSQVKKKDSSNLENRLFNIGVELAPILYFYVYSIMEYAIKHEIPKIYYFTREGETFIKIHRIIQKNNPCGVKLPECDILEVSRIATFLVSMKEFSIEELLRIWSQYRYQNSMNMKALFKSLNLNIDSYQKYLEKYKINSEEKIYEPWFDIRVQELCHDEEFIQKVNEQIQQKRNELLEYFEKAKGIQNDTTPLFGVDIGWRGTIQDNLCHIFSQKQIGGYYLTLYDFYNRQPKNSYKLSFIDDNQIRDNEVNAMITLLEWIYNPGTGSVTGYQKDTAIRKAKKDELEVVNQYIKPLQEGMFASAELLNEYMKYHPYEAKETKKIVYDILRNTKENPPKELVDAYYSMVFNDTFGTAEYIEKEKSLSFMTRINPFKIRKLLKEEMWKEAFMVHYHVTYMKSLLDIKKSIRKLLKKDSN